ncbi:hypothetical protein [Haladaptatus sp. R4]|uniref:hypothetical protein n=1 Tax=Haladaptatus sp. R4 TaxID=1679489 RepID=UPI000A7D9365|nr:hypothetical protein [Haladaptatus sp. R4]
MTQTTDETSSNESTVKSDASQPSGASGTTHIQIDEIRKTFNDGEIVACDDVNIDIDEGEFVVFVGPLGMRKNHHASLHCWTRRTG